MLKLSEALPHPAQQETRARQFVIDRPGDIIAYWVKRYRFASAVRN